MKEAGSSLVTTASDMYGGASVNRIPRPVRDKDDLRPQALQHSSYSGCHVVVAGVGDLIEEQEVVLAVEHPAHG